MEARIKFSREEMTAMCEARCEGMMPAPTGMKWSASLMYGEATCELGEMVAAAPPSYTPRAPAMPVPMATTPTDPEEVTF